MELIRYVDGLLVCCESEEDAKEFRELLEQRLVKFGLKISENKTRVVKFGKKEWQQARKEKRKTKSFDFLGFTHYSAKSRSGTPIVGHKTSKINIAKKFKEIKEWIKTIRNHIRLKN
ncbi:MAG: reverse transcriptase domain-containing protein [Wolbachia sp.]